MNVIFTPYYLDKYKPDYHAFKMDDWFENLFAGKYGDPNEVTTVLNKQIATFVERSINEKKLPVSVCGECLKSFGVLKGLKNSGLNPALLWLDAHGDFNTHKTTPSNFIGGMSLAIITGHEEHGLLSGLELSPLEEERVIIFDRRNLDEEEAVLLKNSKLRQPANFNELLKECSKEKELYVHIDTDIINPVDAPAMIYRSEGGPMLQELINFIMEIKNKIVAVSITMWEPDLDPDKKSEKAMIKLLSIFQNE